MCSWWTPIQLPRQTSMGLSTPHGRAAPNTPKPDLRVSSFGRRWTFGVKLPRERCSQPALSIRANSRTAGQQDSRDGPSYHYSVHVFPAVSREPNSYAVYLPARLNLLTALQADGEIARGWPVSSLANGLCFEIVGKDMMQFGLRSREIRVDQATELLK